MQKTVVYQLTHHKIHLCECYKIINMNKRQSHLICNYINNSFCSFNVKLSML